jgi:dihydrofolate reductase
MKISLIVAMARNGVIGIDNKMPWHLSADLKRFKKITMGCPILMGRKTFESIGRPLPGRTNLIVSRNRHYHQPGCQVFNSVEAAIDACHQATEIFIIGGSKLYMATLNKADFIYLTRINQNFQGDTTFPQINFQQWDEIQREDIDDDSVPFSYSFIKLQKKTESKMKKGF